MTDIKDPPTMAGSRRPNAVTPVGLTYPPMTTVRRPQGPGGRIRWRNPPLALVAVLILQTALALRLNGSVATDEATYLVAGHQLLAHLLTGTPAQDYGTYFSGMPGLYPLLAASVDQLTGIMGVRLLSLLCMLVVNICLFVITVGLFGRAPAFFASLVFAIGSGAAFLSWYATFDATSLALLATATMLAFKIGSRPRARQLLIIGGLLVLAVAVKYVVLEFVPAVVAIVALRGLRQNDWRRAAAHIAIVGLGAGIVAALAFSMVSPSDWVGFTATSSAGRRVLFSIDRLSLLGLSWSYIGLWVLLAFVGLVITFAQRRWRWESTLVFATGLLPIVTQVMLTEATSLHKHTTFGFFFAAPLAGLAVATGFAHGRDRARSVGGPAERVLRATSPRPSAGPATADRLRSATRLGAPVVVAVWLFVLLGSGMASASEMQFGWPHQDEVVQALEPYVTPTGHYLADNPSIPGYLFADSTEPSQWASPSFFGYPIDHQMVYTQRALDQAVDDDFFDAIVYRSSTFTDVQAEALLPMIAEHYRLAATIPYDSGNSWYVWIPLR